jgi:hypothetical protein
MTRIERSVQVGEKFVYIKCGECGISRTTIKALIGRDMVSGEW